MNEEITEQKHLKVAQSIVEKYIKPDSVLYKQFVSMVLDGMTAGIEIARNIMNDKADTETN